MKSKNSNTKGTRLMKVTMAILGTCAVLGLPLNATTTADTGAARKKATALQGRATLHRVLTIYPVDRARIEKLQQWVNSGHEAWCLQPELVASETLTREAPNFPQFVYEQAAFNATEGTNRMREVFTYHSLDGRTSYRVTVRRYAWLRGSAGSVKGIVWVPESLETVNENLTD